MNKLKDEIAELIYKLPDDSSLEDILYHLYVLDKVGKGQKSIKDGRGISHDKF